MAEINQSLHTRFAGLHSGEWAFIVVTFEHDEATAAAAITATIGAVALSAPPPANIIVPAVCADRAAEIIRNNGPDGVFIEIDCPVVAAGSPEVRRIGPRHK